jgi:hypothetical protein
MILAGTLGLALVAGSAALVAQNTLASLGIEEADARRDIVYALEQGYVNYFPARNAFKAAAPAARATLVKTAMAWAQAYTQTPAFKAAYEKARAEAAPKAPTLRNVDQELAKQKAERRKGIEDAKANLSKMPAEMRDQMAKTIKEMEAQNARMEADPQMAAMMRQGVEMQNTEDKRRYQNDVAAHAERYPADPAVLIAKRLRRFLEVSKDVDYTAKLVARDGRQHFVNPQYEAKPSEWKLCFRAGREPVDAARAAAQAWLTALGK